jgi:exosome complex component CSL4
MRVVQLCSLCTHRRSFSLQDIRAAERDKVEVYKSFRPGDIVRAEVLSLGDARSFYLTTAKNELGVIYAKSTAGAPLVPVSWCEMECTATGTREFRKVAKLVAPSAPAADAVER